MCLERSFVDLDYRTTSCLASKLYRPKLKILTRFLWQRITFKKSLVRSFQVMRSGTMESCDPAWRVSRVCKQNLVLIKPALPLVNMKLLASHSVVVSTIRHHYLYHCPSHIPKSELLPSLVSEYYLLYLLQQLISSGETVIEEKLSCVPSVVNGTETKLVDTQHEYVESFAPSASFIRGRHIPLYVVISFHWNIL